MDSGVVMLGAILFGCNLACAAYNLWAALKVSWASPAMSVALAAFNISSAAVVYATMVRP